MVDIADLKSHGPNAAPNPNCACKQPTFSNLIISVSEHPSNFISLHLKGLNTPLWWNGRHSGLKIHLKRFSTGSSPVSGTIFLISEQFFCSEIFTFRVGLRWWHWQKTACCFRPNGCRYSLSFRLCCDQAMPAVCTSGIIWWNIDTKNASGEEKPEVFIC